MLVRESTSASGVKSPFAGFQGVWLSESIFKDAAGVSPSERSRALAVTQSYEVRLVEGDLEGHGRSPRSRFVRATRYNRSSAAGGRATPDDLPHGQENHRLRGGEAMRFLTRLMENEGQHSEWLQRKSEKLRTNLFLAIRV